MLLPPELRRPAANGQPEATPTKPVAHSLLIAATDIRNPLSCTPMSLAAHEQAKTKGEEAITTRVSIVEADEPQAAAESIGSLSLADGSAGASSAAASSSGLAAPSVSAALTSDLSAPFHLLSDTVFAKDSNAAVRRLYAKWNIDQTCDMHRWRYTQSVDKSMKDDGSAGCAACNSLYLCSLFFLRAAERWI